MNEHESLFIAGFIVPERRARYLQLLSNPKLRAKALARLNHSLDIDYSTAVVLEDNSVESLKAILKKRGAGRTCHVIADASPLDGKDLPLGEALAFTTLHQFGVVLSCVPGKLAYYKTESPGPKYILQKASVR